MASVDRKRVPRRSLLVAGLLFAPANALWGQLPQGAAPPVELDPPQGVAEEPFTFARDGLTLNGTLAMSGSVSERVPVVVIVAGSGPTDRNANGPFLNTNAYAMLAWGLAERGIASLRYDKRGIGMSAGEGGDPTTLTTDHYVADVAAAATALASDARFSKVVLLGHSEGAGHVLQAANRGAPQAGVIMVAGQGRMLADVLHEQFARQADSTTVATIDSAFARFLRGDDPGEVPPFAQPVLVPQYRNFLRSMAAYDPASEARRFDGPLLIVQGTTDVQVTMRDAELLHAAQPRATLVRLEGVNHVLKSIASMDLQAQTETYRDPSLPLAAPVVPAIAGWIEDLDR
jgi:pimeloyl-ACP methyl ester carboxylesterase